MNSFRRFAVPILLIVVATIHFCRHHWLGQSSWGAGCGFGMFATVDYHGSRYYRCYLLTDQGRAPVRFAPMFAQQELTTRILPSRENLSRLAQKIASLNWRPDLPGDDRRVLTRSVVRLFKFAFYLCSKELIGYDVSNGTNGQARFA